MSAQTLQLIGALRRISQSLDSHSKFIEHSAGLTLPQLLLLEALRREPDPLTAGRLAQQVSLTQGTVTSILDRLEDRGLIHRGRAADDRRRVLVTLTPLGHAKLDSAPPLMHADFLRRFDALAETERDLLLQTLEQIAALMRVGEPAAPTTPKESTDRKEVQCVALPASADLMDGSPIPVR